MDLKKGLEILVVEHLEEQMKDPQTLGLAETIEMLGGSRCGDIHEGMLPGDVAKCIMADLADLGLLEQVKRHFEELEEDRLLEETSLYEIMADLGEVDWH